MGKTFLSEIVKSIANESYNWEPDDIQSLILDICKNNKGIHYGMSNNKWDIRVCKHSIAVSSQKLAHN